MTGAEDEQAAADPRFAEFTAARDEAEARIAHVMRRAGLSAAPRKRAFRLWVFNVVTAATCSGFVLGVLLGLSL